VQFTYLIPKVVQVLKKFHQGKVMPK